jgi:hypothetical protein
MRVGGGEQRVRTMPCCAVLVPARGLEGAQAGVRRSTRADGR